MFKLVVAPAFQFTAQISAPDGAVSALPLTGLAMSRKEFMAWQQASATAKTDEAWLCQAVTGWGDGAEVRDEKNKALPFTPANLAKLLDRFPASVGEIARAYGMALFESRLGN